MTEFVYVPHLGTATLGSDEWIRVRKKDMPEGEYPLWKFTLSHIVSVDGIDYCHKVGGTAPADDLALIILETEVNGDFHVCMEPETMREFMQDLSRFYISFPLMW